MTYDEAEKPASGDQGFTVHPGYAGYIEGCSCQICEEMRRTRYLETKEEMVKRWADQPLRLVRSWEMPVSRPIPFWTRLKLLFVRGEWWRDGRSSLLVKTLNGDQYVIEERRETSD